MERAVAARAVLEEAERVARARRGAADERVDSSAGWGEEARTGRRRGAGRGTRSGGNRRRGAGAGSADDTSNGTDRDGRGAEHHGDGPGGNGHGAGDDGPKGDPQQVARAICLRLLTVQPRTRAELAAALAKRDVPADAADAVLDRFSEVGLIDDAAFARAWVETRQRGRGLGRTALAGELRKKGVDKEIVQEALQAVDADDDLAAAERLVAKKLPSTRGLPPDKRARRLVGMLARRGHPAGLAYRVVRDALAAEGTDPDLAGVPDPTLSDD